MSDRTPAGGPHRAPPFVSDCLAPVQGLLRARALGPPPNPGVLADLDRFERGFVWSASTLRAPGGIRRRRPLPLAKKSPQEAQKPCEESVVTVEATPERKRGKGVFDGPTPENPMFLKLAGGTDSAGIRRPAAVMLGGNRRPFSFGPEWLDYAVFSGR